MSYLQMQVIGNVGRVSELRMTQTGKDVINFTVASNERFGEEEQTVWVEVTAWNGLAVMLDEHLLAGQSVMVAGRPQARLWQDGNGESQVTLALSADTFRFVGRKPE